MSSARRLAANSANAKRSTGPRTREGKAASSRNALRHGLATPISGDAAHAGEIDALVAIILDGVEDQASEFYARIVAEQCLEIQRIQSVKSFIVQSSYQDSAAWIEEVNSWFSSEKKALTSENLPNALSVLHNPTTPPELQAMILGDLNAGKILSHYGSDPRASPQLDPTEPLADGALELQRFGRYERRAISKRKRAMRALRLALKSAKER